MTQTSKLAQATNAIESWVEHVIHDEAIGYEEAFAVVMAKIQAKISESKRQRLDFVADGFEVTTTYSSKTSDAVSSITGWPHVEVSDGGIKFGCILITKNAILEMIVLLSQQLKKGRFTAQTGYMPK